MKKEFKLWSTLSIGTRVRALTSLDRGVANIICGDTGVVVEEAEIGNYMYYGPLVKWDRNGNYCSVYPGQVEFLFDC